MREGKGYKCCFSGYLYEVFIDNSDNHVMNLAIKGYNCGEWQISDLSYVHIIKCIDTTRVNVEVYVHYYLKKKKHMLGHTYPLPLHSSNTK